MDFEEKLEDARLFIAKNRSRRQSNKVLHGHPSPMHWRIKDVPVADVMRDRKLSCNGANGIGLYIATPYCLPTNPERCGFCLFPSEDFLGQHQLTTYLNYLESEARMYRPHMEGEKLSSIYFGGGTANLYPPHEYARLLEIVDITFPGFSRDIEITLEGVPQLFNREKLVAAKAAGFNRISVGVEQLQDHLIALSGRKQTARHTYQTIALCESLDLDVSVDLIFGWPRQTLKDMLHDLEAMVGAGVRHITHYELNVAGRSDFARNHKDTLPSLEQNLEMYRASRDYLLSQGFTQATIYDFEKRDPKDSKGRYRYEEQLRNFSFNGSHEKKETPEMFGLGFAGVSIFPGTRLLAGWAYMNPTNVADYFSAIDQGRFPANRGYRFHPADQRLLGLFQSTQAMVIDRRGYRALYGLDAYEEFLHIWAALDENGWLRVTDDKIEIIGDGAFFAPMFQALLAKDRVEEIREGNVDKPAGELVQIAKRERHPSFRKSH